MEGRGLGELLDEVVRRIPLARVDGRGAGHDSVAVLGRPNVGKSSLVNRLLGEERMIVDDAPGTTRDSIDAPFRYHGRRMVVVDTAGLRRKLGSQPNYEFYATLRATRSLESADVAVLVLDASQPITTQDVRIAKMIDESGRACVWAFNKWDLVAKDDKTAAHLHAEGRRADPVPGPCSRGVRLRPHGAACQPASGAHRRGLRSGTAARSRPPS